MKKLYTLLFLIVFMAVPYLGRSQCSILTTGVTQSLALTGGSSYTKFSVAYNPVQNVYYTLNGTRIQTHSSINGTLLDTYFCSYNMRSIWWNANTNGLEGNGYSGAGIIAYSVNSVTGYVGSESVIFSGSNHQPYYQSQGAYDDSNDEIIYYYGGNIYRYSRATGNLIGTIAVSGLPSSSYITNYNVVYTGCAGKEVGLYDYSNRRLLFINKATGVYVGNSQLPATANAPSSYSVSFSDEKLWVSNGTSWSSYKTTNYGLQTSSILGPFCDGSSVSVNFTINSLTFNSGNVFTAQLSDANGGFSSPTTIGSVTSTTATTIAASIPANTIAGSGYRIRVVSSNPIQTGSDNGTNLVINVPSVNLGPDVSICPGDTAYLSGPIGVLSYNWSNGGTNQINPVTTAGTYSVTVSNSVCSKSDTIVVSALSAPVPTLSDTLSLCGTSTTLNPGSFSSYAWSTGASTSSISVNTTGNYQVTVTGSNTCTAVDGSFVNFIQPAISTGDTAICSGDSVELNSSVGCYFSLTNISTSNSYGVYAGSYTGDDRGGIAVTPNYVYLTGDNYTVRYNSDLTSPISLTRTDGIFSDLLSGKVYTLASGTGSFNYNSISSIQELNDNLGSVGSPINLSQTIVASNGSSVFAGSGYVIIWAYNDNHFYHIELPTGMVTDLGSYNMSTVRYSSENWANWGIAECNGNGYSVVFRPNTNSSLGTSNSSLARFNIATSSFSQASAFSNTTLNDMASITYSPWNNRWYFHSEGSNFANSSSENLCYADATHNGVGGSNTFNSFAWSNGSTNPYITVSPTSNTDYSVTVSHGSVNCYDTISVTVNSNPTFTLNDTINNCNVDSFQISASGSYSSYDWSTGQNTQSIYVSTPGQYFATVTNSNGCSASDSTYVNLLDARINQADTTLCSSDSLELVAGAHCGLYMANFTTTNMVTAYNNTGDDRGGIAITPNYVYSNGDSYCTRYDKNLGSSVSYQRRDGIFSDLGNGELYTFWSTTASRFDASYSYDVQNIDAIRSLNSSLVLGTTINLSQTINAGSGSLVAAGNGFVILWSNFDNNFYKITLNNGLVEVIGNQEIYGNFYGSESWASWGVAECSDQGYSIAVRSSYNFNGYYYNSIGRFNIDNGTWEEISNLFRLDYVDISDVTYSPWDQRWYFSHESSATGWGQYSENIGYADASASQSGGTTSNASVLWSTTETENSIIVNPSATTDYSVAVSHGSNVCGDTVSIAVITSPTVTVTDTDLTCFGDTNGIINLAVSGGTTPYTYGWSNSVTSSTNTGLTAGTYAYSVTAGNNCVVTDSVEISAPSEILVSSVINQGAACYTSTDGSATVSVSGGTPSYTYLWPSGATDSTDTQVSGGWNVVTITDASSCVVTDSINMASPASITTPGPITSTTTFFCPGTAGNLVAANYGQGVTTATYSVTSSVKSPTPVNTSQMNFSFANAPAGITGSATLKIYFRGDFDSSSEYLYLYDENGSSIGNTYYPYYGSCTNYTFTTLSLTSTQMSNWLADGVISFLAEPRSNVENYASCPTEVYMELSYDYTSDIKTYWFESISTDTNQAIGQGATVAITPQVTTTYYAASFSNNCNSEFDSITVIVPPAPTTTYLQSPASICAGETTSITAYGAVSYAWPTGDPTISGSGNTATVTPTGTTDYLVTISNAFNCQYVDTMTITVLPSPVGNVLTTTPVSCSNNNDGQAVVYGTGGQPPYAYAWSNGNSGALQLGLAAGSYTVTVSDGSSCSDTLSVVVGGQVPMGFNETLSNVSCNGLSDGSISLAISGGSTPYTYVWSNGGTSSSVTGLAQGSYSVTVSDNAGCSHDTTFNIIEPTALLTGISNTTQETCPGVGNGSITSQTSGGTAPYSYAWTNGGTTAMLTGLNGGTYTLTVTDASGCTATTSGVVTTIPSTISSNITAQTNVACFNGTNGSATAVGTGGASPYAYDWNDGSAGSVISGVAAGTYTVTVTDGNSCEHINTVTITEPTQLTSSSSVFANATCFGLTNGSASITVTGGTPGYTYLWSDGSTSVANTTLGAGTFMVTVTDLNSCTDVTNVSITEPTELIINPTQTDISCNGLTDGALATAVSGGTSAYSYLWSNSATTTSINGLATGSYSVTVTDANSCQKDSTFTIIEPNTMTASIASSTNIACKNDLSGSAEAIGNGGTSPYSYLWSNGATTAVNTGLAPGTFTVTVTDANGCNDVTTVVITEPATLFTINMTSATNVMCNSFSTGSATIEANGGDMPYTYLWSNGYTDTTNTALSAGTYMVTVTDANGCVKTETVTITEPAALTLNTVASSNVTCFGESNGSAMIIAAGGTPTYNYLWSNGSATSSISSVGPGTYTMTVTDVNSCTQSSSVVITEPTQLSATITNTQNVACNGSSTGFAVVAASGGTTPYSYNWVTGSTVDSIYGQPSGFYGVTITDGNGCVDSALANLTQPSSLSASVTSATNNTCYGDAQGAATVAVVGGQSPYNYAWPNGATTASLTAMNSGNYIVTITDNNNCQDTALVSITEPTELMVSIANQVNPLCFGNANAEVTTTTTGGVAGYSYLWSNNDADSVLDGVSGGTYMVTVTDNNSCTDTMTVNVLGPTDLISSVTVSNALCNSDTNGYLNTVVTGATLPYSYLWSNNDTSSNALNLGAGTYTVTITDANGCADTLTNTISEPAVLSNTLTSSVDLNCTGVATGSASTTTIGGTMPYGFAWTGGETTENAMTLLSGVNVLTVTDANGCMDTTSVTLSAMSNLNLALVSVSDIACNGDTTANIVVTATGGSGLSTFSWSVSGLDSTLTNQPAGNYQAYVSDNLGCLDTLDIIVMEPTLIMASQGASQNPLCVSDSNGWAEVIATGGVGSYSYLWPSGDTNAMDSMLMAGTHTVTITDSNSCSNTFDVLLVDPQGMSNIGFNIVNVTCYSDMTGSAVVNPIGGLLPYTTTWSNGQSGNNAIALSAGTYSVQVVDANGCVLNDTAVITSVNPLTPSMLPDDTNSCGDPVTLTANAAFNSYNWSTGGAGQTVQVTTTTTVNFNGVDANGCTTFDTVQVNMLPAPVVNLGSDISGVCEGVDQVLDAGSFVSYAWSTGETTQTVTVNASGVYTVTATDTNGCEGDDDILVNMWASPVVDLGPDTVVCSDVTPITFELDGGTGFTSYVWSTGGTSQTETISGVPGDKGDYSVIVENGNGCQGMDTINVEFDVCGGIGEPGHALTISMYPNPTKGDLTINLKGFIGESVEIEVMTTNGQLMKSKKLDATSQTEMTTQMDLNDLAQGLYFVMVKSGDEIKMERITIY